MRAHSSHAQGLARWAAAVAFAGALTAVTALPVHAAGSGYNCEAGSYKPALGLLGALDCTGSGSTNIFVTVNTVTVVGSGSEGPDTFFCTDFARSGNPGHWSGHCK